jgi:hypothetical protein
MPEPLPVVHARGDQGRARCTPIRCSPAARQVAHVPAVCARRAAWLMRYREGPLRNGGPAHGGHRLRRGGRVLASQVETARSDARHSRSEGRSGALVRVTRAAHRRVGAERPESDPPQRSFAASSAWCFACIASTAF